MSKISQELKILLYLNQRYTRKQFVSIKEIADYLDVSDRQARRYLEDINSIPNIHVETRLGRDGGYRLRKPIDDGYALPENLVLAMSIAMKRNEKIEKILYELPNYVITDVVEGDNKIDNRTLDNLETIIKAIQNRKTITFKYKNIPSLYIVDPYKVVFTNKTYYLKGAHNDEVKTFDVHLMEDMKTLSSYKFNNNIEDKLLEGLTKYGVRTETEAILRVKCVDEEAVLLFDKYFEGKGEKDMTNLIYTVTGSDEHELYYPLFRISTKKYVFLDKEFKNKYLFYLRSQIKSIEKGNE